MASTDGAGKDKRAVSPWKIIVKSDEYRKWKSAVKRKCEYKCVVCGKHKKEHRKLRFDCHHIKPKHLFPLDMLKPDNGVLMCMEHHIIAHKEMQDQHPEYNDLNKVSSSFLWKMVKNLHFTAYKRRRYRKRKTIRSKK